MTDRRQIFAFSGMLRTGGDTRSGFDLVTHALRLSGEDRGQRVCYVPTAVGDSPVAVQAQVDRFAEPAPMCG